ncbi:MAG: hypothetical protein DHS80DRAFT_17826 [Piptocephalis tieghemiana]|nr:MAG: hypothetical protein DHS80DRAFT_17826 [Piptocephalis tieghemiana]
MWFRSTHPHPATPEGSPGVTVSNSDASSVSNSSPAIVPVHDAQSSSRDRGAPPKDKKKRELKVSNRKLKKLQKRYPYMSNRDAIVMDRYRKRAEWLDGKHRCCGCCHIGIDPLVGLFPVIGDFTGTALALHAMRDLHEAEIPSHIMSKMFINVAIDTAIGFVPLLGDLLDMMYTSNLRNADILEEYLTKRGKKALARSEREVEEASP